MNNTMMECGTYILSIDRSPSVWGQTWFENYPLRFSGVGLERLSICDNSFICHGERMDLDIEHDKSIDVVKQKIIDSLFANESSEFITLTKLTPGSGNRYSHIYRPIYISKYDVIYDFNPLQEIPSEQYIDPPIVNYCEYNDYIRQLTLLLTELFDVFQTVEPNSDNVEVYGNTFRNIIILACTEVDGLMKKVSMDNGLQGHDGKYSTKDYVNFKNPLQIDKYTTCFNFIDELGETTPFLGWDSVNSTQSLSWYNAYNLVKHDRINNKEKANMKNAIESVMAFAVVMMAQFGYRNSIWENNIGKYIKVINEPLWNISDFYFPVVKGENWKYINYPLV